VLKRWEIAPRAPQTHFDQFRSLPPWLAQVLYNRGLIEAGQVADFLAGRWPEGDPFELPDEMACRSQCTATLTPMA